MSATLIVSSYNMDEKEAEEDKGEVKDSIPRAVHLKTIVYACFQSMGDWFIFELLFLHHTPHCALLFAFSSPYVYYFPTPKF